MKDSSKRLVRLSVMTGTVIAVVALSVVLVTLFIASPASHEQTGNLSAVQTQAGDDASATIGNEAKCDYPKEWIGKKADEAAVKKQAKVYRILGPNSAATMDFNPQRINVLTDDDGVVKEVTCG